jgi:PKD repeat protein
VAYDFTWTGPNGFISTNEDISGLEAGTYVVTVTDASGCSYQDSITLVEPEELDAVSLVSDYNGVDISCGGAADGWIDLTVTGGAEPYTFTWNTGQITEDIDGLVAGIYTYTVIDANGCEIGGSITLVEPDELLSFFTTSDYNGYNISCFGLSDGSVDLTVNNGTAPYTYVWSNGPTSADLMNVPAGTYVFDITDANGCTLQDSVTLTQPDDIVITPIDTTIISCFGEEDGGFEVVASGGVPAFMYDWLDGQTGPIAQNLGAGSYMVTATDINGCKDSILLSLTVPDLLVEVQVVDVVCFGQENAIVDINLIGGTAPYTYNWSNDSISQDLNGVAAGTYTLEVTDANGCTDILSVVVSEPEQLIMTVDTVIDATCSGNSDGLITVQAQGGTAPYTYFWPNLNQSGSSATGLAVGVYEVQVVDDNGCAWSLNVDVGQLLSIDAAIDVLTTVSCNELEDAEALVTATGGTEPYTYLWSNGDSDILAEGLGAGTLMVTVSDAVGCDTTLSVEIVEPAALEITIDALYNVTCSGFSNGQVEVGIAGGMVPYDVSWSNGDLGYIANDLEAGSHTVYVTDANGCLDSLATVFTEPDTITMIQYSTNVVTCFGGSDGELTVLVDGGTPPLSYTWPFLGQTGNTATNLSTGWYTFVAMDDNGCTYADSLLVTETEEIILTLSSDTVVCHGSGVEINASATGGAGNFSYSWDNGLGLGATHFVSPITAITYSVEITDQSGCSAEIASVTVDIATQPVAEFSSTSDEPCVLPTTFEFTNTSTNVSGYEWLLGNGSISTDENPTTTYDEAGSYTVTLIVTTGVGCSDTASATVVVDDVPTADFTLDNAQGCAPIQVNFGLNSPSGLDYYWDFGDGSTSTAPNPTHWYELPGDFDVTLIVSAPGGCTDTLSSGAAVSVYPSPIAGFTPQQIAFPEPGSEYEFINNSSNADLYNWDFGNGEQSDEFQPIYDYPGFGGYHVTLTAINEFGCADTAVHYINVESNTTLYVPNALGIGQPGDAGIFIPAGTGIEEYHLWIFDNWGNLLWETQALDNHSPAEGWDGQYKGQYVPQGSYVWKLDATFIGSEIWEGQESSNGKTSNTGSVMVLY